MNQPRRPSVLLCSDPCAVDVARPKAAKERPVNSYIFAEVADSFMGFMGDGIFVAHNVNFDYGFISHEYARLDRRFRFPKLCTVAAMRRRNFGHKSYGLGRLCEVYNIDLETHHRALCDARATSHLLNLINAKREQFKPDQADQAA
jgi:DNA polymerase-3 subunit epsilon